MRPQHPPVPGTDPRDAGDIVLSWLTKLAVVFTLVAVVLFDAISIGTTAVSLDDSAGTAATAASESWQQNHDLQSAYNAAVEAATKDNAANTVRTKDFTVADDGTVHLTVSREATTLVVYRLSATRGWGQISRSAQRKAVNTD